jgi:5-formaminoimidazole-4-carboxamide-1-(beta)-D-ribofuranosyl 5'-monophosphate synthetase
MAPGMIGAFCLQTIITPEMKPVVYDVAFRIGGGTNVHGWVGHTYGNLLWRQRMSSGRRTALELRRAIENNMLHEILT